MSSYKFNVGQMVLIRLCTDWLTHLNALAGQTGRVIERRGDVNVSAIYRLRMQDRSVPSYWFPECMLERYVEPFAVKEGGRDKVPHSTTDTSTTEDEHAAQDQ